MSSITMLKVRDLHPQIICPLCSGYFIDATTIVECLHSFCRSCIVRYLETSKYCPICDVQIHKTKPLLNIRPDKTLQDIVFKLVPGLFDDEMRRRREFYAKNPENEPTDIEENGRITNRHYLVYSSKDRINVALSPHGPPSATEPKLEGVNEGHDKLRPKRYFYCPAMVTVGHLKHLLKSKFGPPHQDAIRIEIYWKNAQLPDPYTMLDIGYSYPWNPAKPMELTYRVVDSGTSAKYPFDHFASWKFKKKKRKRKKRSVSTGAVENGDDVFVRSASKKKCRRRDRSCSGATSVKSAPEPALESPEVAEESTPSTSSPPICDTEIVEKLEGEKPEEAAEESPPELVTKSMVTEHVPRHASTEDEAKENVVNVNAAESHRPPELEPAFEPATSPRCPSNVSCDIIKNDANPKLRPCAKAASPPPLNNKSGDASETEPEMPGRVEEQKQPPREHVLQPVPSVPCPPVTQKCQTTTVVMAKRPEKPKSPDRTPAGVIERREMRKRKRCLTPVLRNGVAEREHERNGEREREELRSERLPPPPLNALPSSPSLYPWSANSWAQYYQRHFQLHASLNSPVSPGSPLLPPPLSLSPSPLSPSLLTPSSSSSMPTSVVNSASLTAAQISPYPFLPPSPAPMSPFGSPRVPIPLGSPALNSFCSALSRDFPSHPFNSFSSSSASASSSTLMWGSSASASASHQSMNFRQYHHHQHLHHHHYTPPAQHSLASPRPWDPLDFRSVFDFSVQDRARLYKSGLLNGSASPSPSGLLSPGAHFSSLASSAMSPPIPPFAPFRAGSPSFFTPSSVLPLSPSLDRELPKH